MIKTPSSHMRVPGFNTAFWLLTPAYTNVDQGGTVIVQVTRVLLLCKQSGLRDSSWLWQTQSVCPSVRPSFLSLTYTHTYTITLKLRKLKSFHTFIKHSITFHFLICFLIYSSVSFSVPIKSEIF